MGDVNHYTDAFLKAVFKEADLAVTWLTAPAYQVNLFIPRTGGNP